MEESDLLPQLTGVVIISLPPPDNPSLGKIITAFTLTDSDPPFHHQEPHQTHHDHHLPVQPPPPLPQPPLPQPLANTELQLSLSRHFLGYSRKLMGFVGISIFALVLYSSLFSNTIQQLRRSEDDEKPNSFILPLYHKFGNPKISQSNIELKLGRFVEMDKVNLVVPSDAGITPNKIHKLVSSSVAAVESSTIFPVRGNVYPDGLYFTYILVGNPPRPYYLDIDTGSDLTWIQCDAPCTSCAKGANPLYKPTKGNIVPSRDALCIEVQKNQKAGSCETCHQCDYEIEYADHSSSMGVLARDELRLAMANGSLTKLNVIFGCAYDQQGLLLSTLARTDGILGLSRAKVSLPSQLASQGIINNVVGHCLATDVGVGGYMFLGDDFVPDWGVAWVPMADSPSTEFYHTELVKMNYGSSTLILGGGDSRVSHLVFDSGSSYTYFTKEAYSKLVASLKEVSEVGLIQDASDPTLPICWRAKFPIRSIADVKQHFKTLTLHFGSKWHIVSTKFRIPPEGYLIISKKGNVCLGVLDGSKVHDGSTTILGDISLHGQLVIYDNENKKIGWMPSDCVKPSRFKSLPFFEG